MSPKLEKDRDDGFVKKSNLFFIPKLFIIFVAENQKLNKLKYDKQPIKKSIANMRGWSVLAFLDSKWDFRHW